MSRRPLPLSLCEVVVVAVVVAVVVVVVVVVVDLGFIGTHVTLAEDYRGISVIQTSHYGRQQQ